MLGVARRVKQYGLPANTFLNVNIPAGAPKGFAVTTQAMTPGGSESFSEAKDDGGRTVVYFNVYKEGGGGATGTDMWAVEQGLVAVTPLKAGELQADAQARLQEWFK